MQQNNNLLPFLNQVIEGDCLRVLPHLPAQCIDLVLCDLPYGTTVNPWDVIIDFNGLWEQYKRIIKPNGVIALTAAGLFTATVINSNPQWFRYKIVWIKSKSTNFLNVKKQPLRRHEDICIFYNRQPHYQPQMIAGEPYNKGWRKDQASGCYGLYQPSPGVSSGPRYPYDILCINEEAGDWFYCKTCEHEESKPVHPTQKPVELGAYLIRTFSRRGDIILDNACGSGSFLVAAIREQRNFIGIEKNKASFRQKLLPVDFISIARERVAAALLIYGNLTITRIIETAAELGAIHALIKTGKLKPYITKATAYKLYGRKQIEHWLEDGLLTPRKDGDHSAAWRIDRFELELVVKARYLIQHIDL